mgnify:CR=1 FL=1
MKNETILILLGIGGIGAYLIYKNKQKRDASSPNEAVLPDNAVSDDEIPTITTRPAVINPIANPIIDEQPARTSPVYTLPKYTDEDRINQGVDVEPFKEPAIKTLKDKTKTDSEIYTNARRMLLEETGRISFESKSEQDKYLARANKSALRRQPIEQVPYGLPLRQQIKSITMPQESTSQKRKRRDAMIRFETDSQGNIIIPDSYSPPPDGKEDYTTPSDPMLSPLRKENQLNFNYN